MKTGKLFYLSVIIFTFILSGCVVRSYKLTRDRIDQDLAGGNRGIVKGETPPEPTDRKPTRTTRVVEFEFQPLRKFEKKPAAKPAEKPAPEAGIEDTGTAGNRGYITQSYSPPAELTGAPPEMSEKLPMQAAGTQKYTVQKGETLQKISRKFYGTSRKWYDIYKANKDKLKGPDKIYPGQVIDIPAEPLKETMENLK
jgi:nucleoid-associated protein YgaU